MEIKCNEDVMEYFLQEKRIPVRFKSFRDMCKYMSNENFKFLDVDDRTFRFCSYTITHKNITSELMMRVISTIRSGSENKEKLQLYFGNANDIIGRL